MRLKQPFSLGARKQGRGLLPLGPKDHLPCWVHMWLDPMRADETCRRSVAMVEPRVAWSGSETCGALIEGCSIT